MNIKTNFGNKKLLAAAVILLVMAGIGFLNLKSEIRNLGHVIEKGRMADNDNGKNETKKVSFDSLGVKTERDKNDLAGEFIRKSFVKTMPVLINAYLSFDSDKDGFPKFQDCRDDDENINPGRKEICRDQIDNNCNGKIDENCGVVIKVPDDYKTIQEAVNNAFSGDTVKVLPGIYRENVVMKRGVNLIGAEKSLLSGIKETEKVIIDGDHSGNVVSFPKGADEKTKLSGFVIINSGENLNGIFIDSASPIVENNIIENNSYNIYIRGESSPLIQNNISRLSAKGIQVYNNKKVGYGSPKDRLEKSKLSELDNDGSDNNAGEEKEEVEIKKENHFSVRIINNLITNNRAGIDLYQSSAFIKNNTISHNDHYEGYYGPTYGIYLLQSSAEITNNIITGNGICELCAGVNVGQHSEAVIEFNDIWDNQNNYFCSSDDCVLSETNISVDPEFIDFVNGDYHLSEGSLCKDMGIVYYKEN